MNNFPILIADDEPYVLRSLSFVLRKAGYNVETARDGQEALEKIKECRPKVLFLDIMMPKKNGYEVCAELKANPDLNDIHVIMLSAKGQTSDRQIGMQAGADEYMTKPFSPRQVITRVKEIASN